MDIDIRVSQTYDSESEGEGAGMRVELIDEDDEVIRLKRTNESLR